MADNFPQRLPGMKDLYSFDITLHGNILDNIKEFLTLNGFRRIEPPILEKTELFLRKFGSDVAPELYTFHEPGGQKVSLRPEFTPSVVRMFITESPAERLPIRVQYAGPVFRYEPDDSGFNRQFTQVGGELIGDSSSLADVEIVYVATRTISNEISKTGQVFIQLTLGHIGVVKKLIEQFLIPQRGTDLILGNLGRLKEGTQGKLVVMELANHSGLLNSSSSNNDFDVPTSSAKGDAEHQLRKRLTHPGIENRLGRRSADEIIERFLRKQEFSNSNKTSHLEEALNFASELAQINGKIADVICEAEALARNYNLDSTPLNEIEEINRGLSLYGLESSVNVSFDFGLQRGIDYYSGIVFEIHPNSESQYPPLARGGRYDGLINALGGESQVPALGFAINLEKLVSFLPSENPEIDPKSSLGRVLIIPEGFHSYQQCFKLAEEFRNKGKITEITLTEFSEESLKEIAVNSGIETIIWVNDDGTNKYITIG